MNNKAIKKFKKKESWKDPGFLWALLSLLNNPELHDTGLLFI
jgi:hypothetical protein